jgi:hypothetical protein
VTGSAFQHAMSRCPFRTVCTPPGQDTNAPVREVVTVLGNGSLPPELVDRIVVAVRNQQQFMVAAETPEMLETTISFVKDVVLSFMPTIGRC